MPPSPLPPGQKPHIEWHEIVTSPHPQGIVIYENLDQSLDAIAHLFGEGTPGWRAGILNLPGFKSEDWRSPEKQLQLEEMLTTLLHGKHNYMTILLHTQQVIFISRLEGMIQLETVCPRLAAFLNPGHANEFQYYDLGHHNIEFTNLCEKWAVDVRLQHKLDIELAHQPTLDEQTTFEITHVQKNLRRDRFIMHILVVEDDPATSLLLAQLMNRQYVVSTAADAVEAVREYRKIVPDMVFLDIGLPDMNGLELLHKIMTADPSAFVVMLTANAFKTNLEKALAHGAKGFMAKPFNRDKLNTYIEAALHLKRQRSH